jgi:hypothetical protein
VRALASLLVLLVLLALVACQPRPQTRTVHGVVIDLQARDLAHAESVSVHLDDGSEMRFKVADSVLFSASHLRQHMVFAEPVTVTYEERAEGPVAVDIQD